MAKKIIPYCWPWERSVACPFSFCFLASPLHFLCLFLSFHLYLYYRTKRWCKASFHSYSQSWFLELLVFFLFIAPSREVMKVEKNGFLKDANIENTTLKKKKKSCQKFCDLLAMTWLCSLGESDTQTYRLWQGWWVLWLLYGLLGLHLRNCLKSCCSLQL